MKNHVKQIAVSACVLGALALGAGAGRSEAQTVNPKARPFPSASRDTAPHRGLNFTNIDAVQLLRHIASRQGATIVMDADVNPGRISLYSGDANVSLESLLRFVSTIGDLTWTKVDENTYLVVRRHAHSIEVPAPVVPRRQTPKSEKPWHPSFPFNGWDVYVVPLH